MRSLILLCSLVGSTLATLGYDTIDMQVSDSFECMKSHGYEFYIARVYRSSYHVDTEGIRSMWGAHNAGIQHVDGYIFPCASNGCPSPASQIDTVVKALKGVTFGMLWLDIVAYKWPANHVTNQNFILAMGKELDARGIKWGVGSSHYDWKSIVGADWSALSSKQLWWHNFNDRADLSDFKAFGGWTKPNIHQYSMDAPACGLKVNQNYA